MDTRGIDLMSGQNEKYNFNNKNDFFTNKSQYICIYIFLTIKNQNINNYVISKIIVQYKNILWKYLYNNRTIVD